jgi:hypothetical protein
MATTVMVERPRQMPTGLHAERLQMARDLVGAAFQRAIGQGVVGTDHGYRVRRAVRLGLEQGVNRGPGRVGTSAAIPGQELLVLSRGQQ